MAEEEYGQRVRRGTPWLIAKAAKDPEFRRELLDDPKPVVERELGVELGDVQVEVLEDTAELQHVVLPVDPKLPSPTRLGGQVSDGELIQMLRGSAEHVCTYSFCPNQSDNI